MLNHFCKLQESSLVGILGYLGGQHQPRFVNVKTICVKWGAPCYCAIFCFKTQILKSVCTQFAIVFFGHKMWQGWNKHGVWRCGAFGSPLRLIFWPDSSFIVGRLVQLQCPRMQNFAFGAGWRVWNFHYLLQLKKRVASSGQWACQDPKMQVLYYIRAYFLGLFPYFLAL